MLKYLTVILVLVACCFCADNEVVVGDARASKKRKNAVRIWALILLFLFSKVAVFKVASFMFFFMLFQKFFTFAGILLNFFMKQKLEKPVAPTAPPTMYGPPAEYNTIGYSYGPPEHGNHGNHGNPSAEIVHPGTEYGLPNLTELGGSFNNWLYNKNP